MKRTFNYILSAALLLGSLACEDNLPEEISTLNVSRVFSPTGLEARIVNQTSIRVSWAAVKNAKSYSIQVFEGQNTSGTPVWSKDGIAWEEMPYTIPALNGETLYTVQVMANGDGIADSKWSGVSITTNAEQLFLPVDPEEIKATQVTLKWTAGSEADRILLMPGEKTHTLTSSEKAEGKATITGLAGETTYTARLMRGTATRGTITFTTPIDLGGAIVINPGDDITTIFQNAKEGDVFGLLPGTYTSGDITISKSISIKGARPNDKPVLKGTIFRVSEGAGLDLKDLHLDGTGSLDGNQTIIYAAGNFKPLSIDGCIIRNYTKGTLYVNNATLIESVSISNTIYSEIECNGGDFIDFRNGLTPKFDFFNNTAYNSALARDFFRMDAGGSTNFPDVKSIISIRNNTFNNVSNGNNRRMLYIRLANHEISFEKNMITNTQGYHTNQASTNIVKFDKNNYFNAPNFKGSTQSGAKNDPSGTTLDPGYTNAAGGNFKVSNEELRFQGIGDPRWLQ
ncbi:fibronectin type III domain-containing protein [Leadbetterella byssophila]|uniref:fibronectin type III domain-containing protein n=1 Tax=Leadbetterella byssophila TaxID=316068 RepID=UPI0039A250B1